MRGLRKLLRLSLVWWLPGIAMLAAACAAFAFWLAGSQRGTELLLRAVAGQLDGRAEGIQGSLWRGVRVRDLALAPPGLAVEARDLVLRVDWRALSDRVLRVNELSAQALRVETADGAPAQEAQEPFAMPALPLRIAVDRLAFGRLDVALAGQALPVVLSDLESSLAVGEGAQWRIRNLAAEHTFGRAQLHGSLNLARLAAPWPVRADLAAELQGIGADSPLCAGLELVPGQDKAVPGRTEPSKASGGKAEQGAAGRGETARGQGARDKTPQSRTGQDKAEPRKTSQDEAVALNPAVTQAGAGAHGQPPTLPPAGPAECRMSLDTRVEGTLNDLSLALDGEGSGARLQLRAALAPSAAFPVQQADADLSLADGSGLRAQLDWTPADGSVAGDRLRGSVSVDRLDLGRLLAGAIPPALLTAGMDFEARLPDAGLGAGIPREAAVALTIDERSRWNGEPLAGTLRARIDSAGPGSGTASPAAVDWMPVRIAQFDTDLRLGGNRIRTQGSWGTPGSSLSMDIAAARLAAFWPGVAGGVSLKGKIGGTVAAHRAEWEATYTPAASRAGEIGRAPVRMRAALSGGWGPGAQGAFQAGMAGWRGQIERLEADHAGLRAALVRAVPAAFVPGAAAPLWQWQAGATALDLSLPGTQTTRIEHAGSRGGPGRWETRGRADNLVVTPALVRGLREAFDPEARAQRGQRPARVNPGVPARDRRIALDADWDLQFSGALAGRARVQRRDGDLLIPGDPPVPFGLRELTLDVRATPVAAAASRLDARLELVTSKMGMARATGSALLSTAGGGLALDRRQPMNVALDADIVDLAWLGLFVGDSMEIGGRLRANLRASGVLGGDWQAAGSIEGDKLRFVRIDDGVRLVDGTLSARLENERLILESLRFPASLRVIPTEWRTREWITRNPDAQGGEIRASGEWNLLRQAGAVRVVLHRFPALQRSDRYAMVSGSIDVRAEMPRIEITGELKADAGWASLEILSGVPTLDDDVIVVRHDQPVQAPSPVRLSMVMKVDLGPRFYLTGMGLDSGLVGSLEIRLADGRLTGIGALRTRGGRFEAYGQKLHLRRGTITFQESLDNPLLDIEALRLGEQVEAGVRIGGTARRPRIDLVSYPDVSDVEKLSWLVLGRGPDESGNDAALLLSIGAALLGDGEPFYRQFGVDDVAIRSGAMGSSGSLLPDTTVASSVFRSSSADLETQFLVASKRIADGVTFSVEQGMSGSETVARLSYQLSRRLSVDLKGGGVNGIELVYRMLIGD